MPIPSAEPSSSTQPTPCNPTVRSQPSRSASTVSSTPWRATVASGASVLGDSRTYTNVHGVPYALRSIGSAPSTARHSSDVRSLRARRLRLHTQSEPIVVMRADCPVCRSEGLSARSQVLLSSGGHEVIATLYQVEGEAMLAPDEAGLSESAWEILAVEEGEAVEVRHAPALESLSHVRRRIYGHRLDGPAFDAIVRDIVAGRYTEVHLAAFLTASAAFALDETEIYELTRAMVEAGDRLDWEEPVVMDKHCVGGLPGNRTTPIVVAICAFLGLTMPKTSSRAITSPAGPADPMEVITDVDLDLANMRRVVDQQGGCFVWGGGVQFSPADDALIRIERALNLDSEGALVASVLSKKIAAGATHVVIDIPVGPTAKVRSQAAAASLQALLERVAKEFGAPVTQAEDERAGGAPLSPHQFHRLFSGKGAESNREVSSSAVRFFQRRGQRVCQSIDGKIFVLGLYLEKEEHSRSVQLNKKLVHAE